MTHVCLYHAVDLDGKCSAAIWKMANPEGQLVPMNYGWDVPWEKLKDADVTLLDFSLEPWKQMVALFARARSVTWIDHHKSAINEWKTNESPAESCPVNAVLDESKATCELTWERYHTEPAPQGVFLLGDYDAWRHSHPDTMNYQMGMRLQVTDPLDGRSWSVWHKVFESDLKFYAQVVNEGRVVLRYQEQQNAAAAKRLCFPLEFDGKTWLAANRSGVNSKFWDAVWGDSFDGKLGFYWNGRYWTVSLYSDTVDCAEIARRYRGGGHKGAAGFQCSELPFSLKENDADRQEHSAGPDSAGDGNTV